MFLSPAWRNIRWMKPTLIVLAALVATLHTVGQGSCTAQTEAVAAVLATDRQLDRAWNDKDLAALDQLWADDYLFIGWTGEIIGQTPALGGNPVGEIPGPVGGIGRSESAGVQ